MIYATPAPDADLGERLAELAELRRRLGAEAASATPWMGTLRRLVKAAAVESSTSIEGYSVPPEEAVALANADAPPPDPGDSDRMAVASYAHAMDHVGVMAADPSFRWADRVILDLHFDACHFQRDRRAGRWRTGPIVVTRTDGDGVAYRGPDADAVPGLMQEVVEWLEHGDLAVDAIVRAAMAHLHVVSVHPFEDGNGRIARIAQSLVLAREGLVSPVFSSIEEHLAKHTREYYEVLRTTQGGSYQPELDAHAWVAFCVDAHIHQARERLRQIEDAAARWAFLEGLAGERGWPDRLVIALEQSLVGGSDRASYCREADVSPATASNDFRRLLDAGLVRQRGRGRNIRYEASDGLRDELAASRAT